jgi:hypothetical protein
LKIQRGEDLSYFKISAPEIVSGMSGESEANIRDLFTTAKACFIHHYHEKYNNNNGNIIDRPRNLP